MRGRETHQNEPQNVTGEQDHPSQFFIILLLIIVFYNNSITQFNLEDN